MKFYSNNNFAYYALIALVTIVANFPIVFLYKSMFLDDMGRYLLGLEGELHPLVLSEYPLAAYIMDIAHRLMVHSLVFARLYIATLLALSNMILFYILNRLLNFPVLLSLVAAVFPAVLPGQTMIPGFIAGSYTVPGSLFLFLSILFAHKYIKRTDGGWTYIFIFSVMYASSLLVMANSLFFLLPMTLMFLSFNDLKLNNRVVNLLGIIILLDIFRVLQHLSSTALTSQTAIDLSGAQVYVRAIKSIFYMFPVRFDSYFSWAMTGIFIAFFLWGVINWSISLYKKIKAGHLIFSESVRESLPVWLGLTWIISGSTIFLFKSPYFSDRYFHLVSYGSGLLVAFFILKTEYSDKLPTYKKYGSVALLMLIPLMISSRIYWQDNYVSIQNITHNWYQNVLMKIDYPQDSQIIVTGNSALGTAGYWYYSTGYLKYLTGRPDIAGNISYPEMQFYNPFDPSERGFTTHMTGVDLEKPVFLFRKVGGKAYPVKYALQWEASGWTTGIPGTVSLGATSTEELIQSPWKIYKFDFITGEPTILDEGKGLDRYMAAINNLSKIGIAENDILWAGPMSSKTEMRFGLK